MRLQCYLNEVEGYGAVKQYQETIIKKLKGQKNVTMSDVDKAVGENFHKGSDVYNMVKREVIKQVGKVK